MAVPSKKDFDLNVLMYVLLSAVWSLPKLWAHHKSMSNKAGNVSKTVAGAIEATQ